MLAGQKGTHRNVGTNPEYISGKSPMAPAPSWRDDPRMIDSAFRWRGFTVRQLAVLALALVAPTVIVTVVVLNAIGALTFDQMHDVALGAGENPGMITFGAMFLCSPIQRWTGRSQVRVRKTLGIIFYFLAVSNGVMFALDEGLGSTFSEPLLVAGSIAVLLGLPLFLTSNRRAQRLLGRRRWLSLHRLTYPLAGTLLLHTALVGDVGAGELLIAAGFAARLPAIQHKIDQRGSRQARHSQTVLPT